MEQEDKIINTKFFLAIILLIMLGYMVVGAFQGNYPMAIFFLLLIQWATK